MSTAVFTYKCGWGHHWDETRDRNDPGLDTSLRSCDHGDILVRGSRIFNPGSVQVVLKGSGWASKDARAEADD